MKVHYLTHTKTTGCATAITAYSHQNLWQTINPNHLEEIRGGMSETLPVLLRGVLDSIVLHENTTPPSADLPPGVMEHFETATRDPSFW